MAILLKVFKILLVKYAVITNNIDHYTLSVLISTVKQIYCYPSGPVTVGGIVLKAHYECRTPTAVIFQQILWFFSCFILFSTEFWYNFFCWFLITISSLISRSLSWHDATLFSLLVFHGTIHQRFLSLHYNTAKLGQLIIKYWLMLDEKIALYCTWIPEVMYFHLIRNVSSPIATESKFTVYYSLPLYKVCVPSQMMWHRK